MKIYVSYSLNTISHIAANKRYGRWSEENRFSVESVSLLPPHHSVSFEEFDLPIDFSSGETVFVLYVEYSDGDSFGRATGKGEILMVFDYDHYAEIAAMKIREKDVEDYQIEVDLSNTIKVKINNPDCNYFTRIENVVVESFVIHNQAKFKRNY